ncbi:MULTISPECIES: TRAP transporter permease [unclassified Chelatococcus]|uniref:TRAP transporter permease n=1 Tax=unclassified Chelatococcus TaxID=2638111 RepID=UPI0020BFA08F|nr:MULTISPECIES: TRAP transporter permease [unclassified Chelatococcus]MCO5077800.1 TRAP transporter permease [Chelatococcus sp.]CAH1659720.1 TRAP transporter 4TM/12TM fusion protein [Hyphomicrobiales bacterium]CAH1683722.1 TRAP transporter 4TM/12TM fusion protein [Hyphomicrobiales bacterium]
MVHAREMKVPDAEPIANPEHGLPEGFGPGHAGRLLFWIAVAFSTFQIITAFGLPLNQPVFLSVTLIHLMGAGLAFWLAKLVWDKSKGRGVSEGAYGLLSLGVVYVIVAQFSGGLPSQVVRAMHVGFLCLVAGAMLANHRATTSGGRLLGWGIGVAGFLIGIYHWAFYFDLVNRAGELTGPDFVAGIAVLVILFVLVWRVMGPALPIVAGLFLAYCLFGQFLPAPFDHRGYDLEQVVEHMSFGTEGIYAVPTAVSATYIFLFILFGSFLERAGMIQLFTDIAMGIFGGARGGPAKVAVFASALMGTISGSGVANVVSTGQFTIPLMKRFGYKAAFAGGVEATASMGGQIMPPVMGAVAFIMAETIGVPYADIVQAAVIPAILYFGSAFWAVHLEAGKRGLVGMPKNELPSAMAAFRSKWFLLLPLAVLVYLLFAGYTPLYSGSVGLALTVVLILGGAIAAGLTHEVIRLVFWVGLGLLAASFLVLGVLMVVGLVALLIVVSLFVRGGPDTLIACRAALADGARQALPVGLACAVVGIVIGTMTLTGVGTIFGNWVVSIGKGSLILSLILTMFVSLFLGMGIPTIPNYIITSSLAAPALLDLGVPLIVSHMFVFYFGIMADLTPPVALAAFAAAPIAKESGFRIGFQAIRIALPGFVIPYMAVYDPALMLQPQPGLEGIAYAWAVVYMVIKTSLAIGLWGMAAIGYLNAPLAIWERLLATAAAGFLFLALPITDEVGFALGIMVIAAHVWRNRQISPARA